jgi:1,4-dihydroxy-6-naphthoate synthase
MVTSRHPGGSRGPVHGLDSGFRRNDVKVLTFAHSPDPDDAYMFYGFETGAVQIPGYAIRHHLEDIQTLNERALRGEFEITAVSAHAYAHLSDRYWVLSCGASVGRQYGPMLVAKEPAERFQFRTGRVAIPGKWTTAALVLDLWLAEQGRHVERIVMPFDQILDATEKGVVDAGLIIHEGQLTYQRQGLHKLWDAGHWWHQKTGLPLPLGLDVVRVDLGMPLAQEISRAFRASIEYANMHNAEAVQYALKFGRGLDTALAKRFIGMYVNEDTLDQGPEVQKGLELLYDEAFKRKLLPSKPIIKFV